MNNFLDYITEDIDVKRKLLSSMPQNTKTNKQKYLKKAEAILATYSSYKDAVWQYMEAKKEKIKLSSEEHDLYALKMKVAGIKKAVSLLEPINTYYEKLGLDELLYKFSNNASFSFIEINKTLKEIIDKFEHAGIKLTDRDFDVTVYVSEYMKKFMSLRKSGSDDYSSLNDIFEKIYWNNPELLEHIEMNLRKLIRANEKVFEQYVVRQQKELLNELGLDDYEDARILYKTAYNELLGEEKESVNHLIELAVNGDINIREYLDDNVKKNDIYDSLVYTKIETEAEKEKINISVNKLKENLNEYKNYNEYLQMFIKFKNDYPVNGKQGDSQKTIEDKIKTKEMELDKINKKIARILERKNVSEVPKTDISSSVFIVKELYKLYKELEDAKLRKNINAYVDESMNVSTVIDIFRGYNYYRLRTIREVYDSEKYSDLEKQNEEIKIFLDDPNNVIFNGVYIYNGIDDMSSIIVKKYRFENIKITDGDLANVNGLLDKINYIQRVEKLEKSGLDLEKIKFYIEMEKLKNGERID